MEIANLVLTIISTLAAVVSAIAAISAKNEVKELKNQITGNGNVQNCGVVSSIFRKLVCSLWNK